MTDESAATNESAPPSWRNLDQNILKLFPLNLENLLVLILLVLAVATRLYGLGDRVASHDEVNHYVPSYDFSQGMQFRFDPMTHGPLQMHLIALSFVAFGDGDFTARLRAALFSIVTVAIALLLFRRYLGRHGGDYLTPRTVLDALPGVELVEMDRAMADALCCGGGGGNFFTDVLGGGADSSSRVRVREAAATGAEVLAVACPKCARMFDDAVKAEELEDGLGVMDIAEIVQARLA